MEKIILTDIDDVCLDWTTSFTTFMKENGYQLKENFRKFHKMEDRFEELGAADVFNYINDFNGSEIVKYLPPLQDSVENITMLSDMGFKFVGITSMGNTPENKERRLYNLRNCFGDVFGPENIYHLPLLSRKSDILYEWKDTGYFWIEDNYKNAISGLENGLMPHLVPGKYNDHGDINHDGITKVCKRNPWTEIRRRAEGYYMGEIEKENIS